MRRPVVADAVAHQRQALDECQAKALLAGYGIAIPKGGVARSEGRGRGHRPGGWTGRWR